MNRATREIILAVLTEWKDKAGYFRKANIGNLVNQMAVQYANHQNLRSVVYRTLIGVNEPNGLTIPCKDRQAIETEIIKRVGENSAISGNNPN